MSQKFCCDSFTGEATPGHESPAVAAATDIHILESCLGHDKGGLGLVDRLQGRTTSYS